MRLDCVKVLNSRAEKRMMKLKIKNDTMINLQRKRVFLRIWEDRKSVSDFRNHLFISGDKS